MDKKSQMVRRWKVTYAPMTARLCSKERIEEYVALLFAQLDAPTWGEWRLCSVLSYEDDTPEQTRLMLQLECWTLPGVDWTDGPGDYLSLFERCLSQFNEFESVPPPFAPSRRCL